MSTQAAETLRISTPPCDKGIGTVIRSREDSGIIEGSFSQDSAHDLALVLRAGALPASIKYLEERTVGPSLGADSIREGVRASVGSSIFGCPGGSGASLCVPGAVPFCAEA